MSAGEVPFGFALGADGKTIVENERVRGLRERRLSLRAIVAECARLGITSRSGRPLQKTQIERLVRSAAQG